MKLQQQSVLLAGVLALSQLAACSSIGWNWKAFGNSPTQAASAPARTASPEVSASSPASPIVTASAAESGNPGGNEPDGQK